MMRSPVHGPSRAALGRAARLVLIALLVVGMNTLGSPTVALAAISTNTTLTCSALVLNAPATCTVTVTPTQGTGTPTGTVSFSTNGSGTYSGSPCTLAGGTCSVTFTSSTTSNQSLVATYSGDANYGTSQKALAATTSKRNTSTSITCGAATLNVAMTCTAGVADTSAGTASTPAGTVAFARSGGSGTFSGSPCTLAAGSCSVSFTPTSTASTTLTATYSGSTFHLGSSVATTFSAKRASATTVSCAAATVGIPGACTAAVTDSSAGTKTTVTGTVAFSTSGGGAFTSSPCTISAGGCSVSFTPTSTAPQTITATYGGSHAGSSGTTTLTATQASQTITLAQPTSPAPYGAIFVVSATASSGLAVTLTAEGGCAISDGSVTMTSGTTGCTLTASQSGDANYLPASSVIRTVSASKASQPITVTTHAPAAAMYGTSFTVAATASSGLPVTYSSVGGCTNVGATFTLTSGTTACTVTYDQAGDASYDAAPQAVETVSASKASQAITVTTHAPASAAYNTSFTVAATATSGLPVEYTSGGGCTNVGATFTMTSGTTACTVTYDQAGDANYAAAATMTAATAAVKASQSIVFAQPTVSAAYGASFPASASSTSGLAVTVVAGGGCAISDGSVTMTSGTTDCTLTASQSGDANYLPAPGVVHTVGATKAPQTITFVRPASPQLQGTDFPVSATSTSALAVAIAASDGCTISGSTVTMTSGTADCTLTASQPGDANYAAAPNVVRTVGAATRSSAIALVCASATVRIATSCSVSVTDTSPGAGSTATGIVAFSTDGGGTFDPAACTLAAGVCSVAFVPSSTLTQTITASYGGGAVHAPSSATKAVIAAGALSVAPRTTATALACGPAILDAATNCTVTISDTSDGVPSVPVGSVTFSTSEGGIFDSSTCGLTSGSCSVAFTATAAGPHTVTARYEGDALHGASGTTVQLLGQGSTDLLACVGSTGPGIPPPTVLPSGLPGFHAQWYGQSGYPTLCPGERVTAVIAYYNSGSLGWVSGRMGEVAYLGTWAPDPGQDQPSLLGGDGTNGSPDTGWPRFNRVAIQPAAYVGPGQVAWFQFTIEAPATPGHYRLNVRALVESTNWMEDFGVFWPVTVLNADGTAP